VRSPGRRPDCRPARLVASGLLGLAPLIAATAPAETSLVELTTSVARLELAATPDTDVLCAPGTLVGIRLERPATVTVSIAGQPASGSVDGQAVGPLSGVPVGAGAHDLVLTVEPTTGLSIGERPFEVHAVALDGSASATTGGTLRPERIDRPVLDVGRTFVNGVDLLDGHLVLQVTDLELEGRHLALELSRTYSSAGHSPTGYVGAGWRLNYESAVTVLPECGLALVRTADGSTQAFTADDAGSGYRPERAYHTRLVLSRDGTADFVDKSGTRHHFAGRAAGTAASLRLAWIEEPHGDRVTLSYGPDGLLSRVSEWHPRLGPIRTLLLSWIRAGGEPRLASARAWGLGLSVHYGYDTFGNLVSVERRDREGPSTVDGYLYHTEDAWDPHRLSSQTPHGGTATRYEYPDGDAADCTSLRDPSDPRELVETVRETSSGATTTFCTTTREGNAAFSAPRFTLPSTASPATC